MGQSQPAQAMCDRCRNLFSSSAATRSFVSSGRAYLCRGKRTESTCWLRQTCFAALDKYNEKRIEEENYSNVVKDEDPIFCFRNRKSSKDGRAWYDIDAIEVQCLNPSAPGDAYRPLRWLMGYAMPDDPAASYITTRPLDSDVGPNSIPILRTWIKQCSETHEKCPKPNMTSLPTRVLDLGSQFEGTDADLRLHTPEVGHLDYYVALSYCWGGPQLFALTKATFEDMHRSISFATLPKTLQDAVVTTRRLCVRYLWVDALCITQDCSEDKNRELAKMDQVYRNSFITISAASASSCHEGFLQTRCRPPPPLPSLSFPYQCSENATPGTIYFEDEHRFDPWLEPINTRAWTLQERLLAPRVLVYGTWQLRWQCQAADIGSGGKPDLFYDPGSERASDVLFSQKELETKVDLWRLVQNWEEVVIDYTQRNLSFSSDKLVAISAIAALFQRFSGDAYLAGLWGHRLVEQLPWMVDQSVKHTLQPRPAGYIAPTWSWASMQNAVAFSGGFDAPVAIVKHCLTEPLIKDIPTGPVASGVLVLEAPFRTGQLKQVGGGGKLHFIGTFEDEAVEFSQVWLDVEEERPETIWSLRLTKAHLGLLVAQRPDGKFWRIGVLDIVTVEGSTLFSRWYADCPVQEFEIV